VTGCKCENLRAMNKQIDYNKNILISIVNETRLAKLSKNVTEVVSAAGQSHYFAVFI